MDPKPTEQTTISPGKALAFIGTWAIGSEFADNFHRTDLLYMGDLRLTPEGNGF
jgi:hypothetical protein